MYTKRFRKLRSY